MCLNLSAIRIVNRITLKVGIMINIVLFGPPGAGKGTQAKMLSERYCFNHISTGEVIRSEIQRGTELGLLVREVIERGELASDELVLGIIEEYMQSHRECTGNIFDGFPRTTRQAEEFDVILASHGHKVDVMISLDVPDEELISRLLLRAECSGRVDDADDAVIRNRIDVYKAQTAIVADHYSAQGKYVPVDGVGTIEDVFGRLSAVVESVIENK